MSRLRIIALLVVALPLVAQAAPPVDDLVELRLDVEQLARTLEERRAAASAELGALRTERAELQRQLRLAKVRNRTLARLEQQDAAADAARAAAADEWNAPARAAVAVARAHVERSLPFARAGRLATLDRIDAELSGALPDVGRAMERLWRFVEEEAALGREVTLGRQQVDLGDGPRLADVVRIGMALMYVRSDDGRLGWARRDGEHWRFEVVDDEASRAVIAASFVAADDNAMFGPAELLIPAEVVGAP